MRTNLRLLTPLALVVLAPSVHGQTFASEPYGSVSECLLRSFPRGQGNSLSGRSGGPRELSALCAASAVNTEFGSDDQGSAASYASLNRGTLGAQVGLSTTEVSAGSGYIGGRASAGIWHTVTLIPAEGVFNYHIPLQLALDGNVQKTLDDRFATATAYVDCYVFNADTGDLVSEMHDSTNTGSLFVNAELTPDFLAPLAPQRYQIQYNLRVEAGMTEIQVPQTLEADYLHTLHFNWSLPEGTTFTSASGVFQPGTIGGVQATPEPAPLLALAAGAAGLLRRRRRD